MTPNKTTLTVEATTQQIETWYGQPLPNDPVKQSHIMLDYCEATGTKYRFEEKKN